MLENYHQRQAEADQEYQQAYQAWIDGMTAEERQQLEGLGLSEAELPKRSGGVGLLCDVAEQGAASVIDKIIDESAEHSDRISADDLRIMEALQKLIGELLTDKNPALAVECLALVSGVAYSGNSMVSLARRHGLTRAAVSKRCIELAERIGVKNPRPMKTEHAREIYRERAVEVHRREGREITSEPQRAARIETMGSHASRIAGIWARVKKSDWIKSATPAELLLARRSLRPAFQVADQLAPMIRSKNDPTITRQLEADMAAGMSKKSL